MQNLEQPDDMLWSVATMTSVILVCNPFETAKWSSLFLRKGTERNVCLPEAPSDTLPTPTYHEGLTSASGNYLR